MATRVAPRRLLTMAAAVFAAATAAASPPAPQQYYFLPRASRMIRSGGIAGVFDVYVVRGPFKYATGGSDDVLTIYYPAKFSNMTALGYPLSPSTLGGNQSVEAAFNLHALSGFPLPVAGPLPVFGFEGTKSDESTVRIATVELGRWLYVRGSSRMSSSSADVFEYTIDAVARTSPFADFTFDDKVDAIDLSLWEGLFGTALTGAVDALGRGDANGDGAVDGADVLAWQGSLGDVAPTAAQEAQVEAAFSAASGASAVAAVPEPSTGLGAGMALVAAGVRVARGRRRR